VISVILNSRCARDRVFERADCKCAFCDARNERNRIYKTCLIDGRSAGVMSVSRKRNWTISQNKKSREDRWNYKLMSCVPVMRNLFNKELASWEANLSRIWNEGICRRNKSGRWGDPPPSSRDISQKTYWTATRAKMCHYRANYDAGASVRILRPRYNCRELASIDGRPVERCRRYIAGTYGYQHCYATTAFFGA